MHLDSLSTALLLGPLIGAPLQAQSRTWTFDADFDQGVLLNVNHDAPNNDQLQLDRDSAPFPFVNVACSKRGTVVRIDVDTGQVLGEYLSAPDGRGRNPSRTTVDQAGNVWVANRAEDAPLTPGGEPMGSVVRIGLVIGGTRVRADRTPDPLGEYLAPPFLYNTCIDRDGDGLIRTSRGLGHVLAWSNRGGLDDAGGTTTAEDESILDFVRVAGTQARALAVDGNNDLWVGGFANNVFEKLDGGTGLAVRGTRVVTGGGGYGALVDGSGVLWGASSDAPLNTFLRLDPSAGSFVLHDQQGRHYGVAIDPRTNHVWFSDFRAFRVREFAPDGTLLGQYAHGNQYAQGLTIDGAGNVWVAHSLMGVSTTVGHLLTDGTFVGNVSLLPEGGAPTGVAVDSNGKVWVTNLATDVVQRIDPQRGPLGGGGVPVGEVDLSVDLGPGAGPYNYSDMTGFVVTATTQPQGTWTVVHDTGAPGARFTRASWTSFEPPGTSVRVELRAAETQAGLAGQAFVPATNAALLVGLEGRYCELRTTLTQTKERPLSPILYDLTLQWELESAAGRRPGSRKPGSLLLFPEFDSRLGATTMITVTNTRDAAGGGPVAVEFVYVEGETCLEFNRTDLLTPNDTLTVLASAHHPDGRRGYVYAFAKSPSTGAAIVHDHLIGQAVVTDALASLSYSFNPLCFQGIGDGTITDLDGDGVRDLDGREYSRVADRLLVPRFLGQGPHESELVLVNLTGGSSFLAVVSLLVFNDAEEAFSRQLEFGCWTRLRLSQISGAFSRAFLQTTRHDPAEILGASGHEAGWFWLDGLTAYSSQARFSDPALAALLIEGVGRAGVVADLPFEVGEQDNGDLLLHGPFGDTSD